MTRIDDDDPTTTTTMTHNVSANNASTKRARRCEAERCSSSSRRCVFQAKYNVTGMLPPNTQHSDVFVSFRFF
jgi:hypothetical protein